ncbi:MULTISPECIES: hypothetical protein [unclassified Akkermansia]|uniref:hypothetical protein n=1 Tax=unclassified Akkermansia TaxID=2608915 RepID=UPI0007985BD1|nr:MULTISPECIES: hypothetical protein [unclassified Akkermansia]KXT53910.1 hypothetical protein HMPREF3038_00533 [Akkermansia sp. KLE1797]
MLLVSPVRNSYPGWKKRKKKEQEKAESKRLRDEEAKNLQETLLKASMPKPSSAFGLKLQIKAWTRSYQTYRSLAAEIKTLTK